MFSRLKFKKFILILVIILMFLGVSPVRGTNQSIFTISVWVKPSVSAVSKAIVGKAEEFRVATNGSSQPVCQIKSGAAWQTAATSSAAISVGSWSHVSCTYDLAYVRIYVNGIEKGSQALAVAADDTSAVVKIGRDDSASTPYGYFAGQVDEFKFYSSALTPEQIKIDFNGGKELQLGGAVSASGGGATGQAAEYCVPGDATSCAPPVGEWKFDEKTGGTAKDTSGNGNDANLTNAVWDRGKYGSSRKMTINSSVDSAVVTDPASGVLDFDNTQDFTIETWFKGTAAQTDAYLIHKGAANTSTPGYMLRFNSSGSQLQFRYTDGNGSGDDGFWSISVPTLLNNNWHHIVIAMDRDGGQMGAAGVYMYVDNQRVASDTSLTEGSGLSASNLSLGEFVSTPEISGSIDQVQIFSYARTPAQIAWDYNRGKPVGWWKLDEGEGLYGYDASGRGNKCTLTTMDPLTDWVTGKFGKALDFDGSSDYCTASDAGFPTGTQPRSATLWFKTSQVLAAGQYRIIFQYGTRTTNQMFSLEFGTYGSTPNRLITSQWGNQLGINTVVNDGVWHYAASVYDGTNWYLYLDGKYENSKAMTTATTLSTKANIGGRVGGDYFPGQVDDVRFFNYPLTKEQVMQIMNEGSVVRFGE